MYRDSREELYHHPRVDVYVAELFFSYFIISVISIFFSYLRKESDGNGTTAVSTGCGFRGRAAGDEFSLIRHAYQSQSL